MGIEKIAGEYIDEMTERRGWPDINGNIFFTKANNLLGLRDEVSAVVADDIPDDGKMSGRIRLEVIAPDAAQRLHAVSDTALPEPHSQRNQNLGSHRDQRGDAKNGHHVLTDVTSKMDCCAWAPR